MVWWSSLLHLYVQYLTYLQPAIYGAQLNFQENPDPEQVANTAFAFIFSWFLGVADYFIFSSIMAKHVFTIVRIVLCLYLSHPKFKGALHIYNKFLHSAAEAYLPVLNSLVLRNVDDLKATGVVRYAISAGLSAFSSVAGLLGIAQKLVASASDTAAPAAPLPRRLSLERTDADDAAKPPARPAAPAVPPRHAHHADPAVSPRPETSGRRPATPPPLSPAAAQQQRRLPRRAPGAAPPPPQRAFAPPPPPADGTSTGDSYSDSLDFREDENAVLDDRNADYLDGRLTPVAAIRRERNRFSRPSSAVKDI